MQERIVELQLADPGPELLDELTECAILGLKVDVARYAGWQQSEVPISHTISTGGS
ncbi:hypothetical protein [Nonomuraea mesophila]|uniref:hypothetical protein n=1 Tax=Nonomuraea mesophila TaxID=2530382 RepID=UPI00140E7868|nr:hypothetical protein [Nonomuraea mesophila]